MQQQSISLLPAGEGGRRSGRMRVQGRRFNRTRAKTTSVFILLILIGVGLACHRKENEPPKNLLLITIDTVRADHVGAYGDRDAETPVIDKLAGSGVRFEEAVSTVPLTLPSHSTILSGALPIHHGVRNNGGSPFPTNRPTLATLLSASGFRTAAFIGSFVLDRRFGLSRGFDVYDDEIERDPAHPVNLEAERPANEVVDRALRWLAVSDPRPFFAWVHLYDAHAPYAPPEPYLSRHAKVPYDGEIAFVDAQIGRIIDQLDRSGLRQKTLIAVVADHGESLGEHGELTHGLLLYEPTLRVPLILSGPGIESRVVHSPVSLADLAPTLAALMAHPLPATDGRDLSKEILSGDEPKQKDLYAETEYPTNFGWSGLAAMRRGEKKYIESPHPELYDLSRDPHETRNIRDDDRRMARDLAGRLATLRAGIAVKRPSYLDPETAAKLQSLGYVAPSSSKATPKGELRDPKEMAPLFHQYEEATWAISGHRIDEAIPILEKISAADPTNPVFRASLARVLRQNGQLARAVDLYREAVAEAPDDPDGWYNLAVALQESGKLRESTEAVKEAIRRDPARPEAHNSLGVAESMQGHLDEALAEFRKVIALDARNASAYNNEGNVFRSEGRLDEAAQAYGKSSELAPRYADPLNGLGALEVQRKRPQLAIPLFDRALVLAPADHEILLNRAIALETMGDRAAAIDGYRRFLAAVGDSADFAAQRSAAKQLLARLERQAL